VDQPLFSPVKKEGKFLKDSFAGQKMAFVIADNHQTTMLKRIPILLNPQPQMETLIFEQTVDEFDFPV
jgi:hypothetical protein